MKSEARTSDLHPDLDCGCPPAIKRLKSHNAECPVRKAVAASLEHPSSNLRVYREFVDKHGLKRQEYVAEYTAEIERLRALLGEWLAGCPCPPDWHWSFNLNIRTVNALGEAAPSVETTTEHP